MALGRTLRISCATTVPCEFLVAHFFVPHFRGISYSSSVHTNMGLRVRASSYQNKYVYIYIYMYVYIYIQYYVFVSSSLHLFTHCISMPVFDRAAWTTGSTLDLKFARSLREACVRAFGLNMSLFGRFGI